MARRTGSACVAVATGLPGRIVASAAHHVGVALGRDALAVMVATQKCQFFFGIEKAAIRTGPRLRNSTECEKQSNVMMIFLFED
jgi:hypothetical protein